MKKHFLKFYDTNVDDVFSYYYERTYDRGKSLELTREYFTESWNSSARGHTDTKRNTLRFNFNQSGY